MAGPASALGGQGGTPGARFEDRCARSKWVSLELRRVRRDARAARDGGTQRTDETTRFFRAPLGARDRARLAHRERHPRSEEARGAVAHEPRRLLW
jgi:hypothetical protein